MPPSTSTSSDVFTVARTGALRTQDSYRAPHPAPGLSSRAAKATSGAQAHGPSSTSPAATRDATPALDLSRIRPQDMLHSLREMVGLLRHGISAQRVFMALGGTAHNPVWAEVLQLIGQRTQGGQALYQAMAAWPTLFDELVQHLVRHGEGEGQLPACIKAVHAHLEFKQAMNALEEPLKGKPAGLVRQAREAMAQGRLLASLAAGQSCELPLDLNLPLAARHCGDTTLGATVLQVWQAQQGAAGFSPNPQSVLQALVAAGVLARSEAQRCPSKPSQAEWLEWLRSLAQARSGRAAAAVTQVSERWDWGRRATLRLALALAGLVLAIYWLR